jgi:hypothetical protein
MHRALTVAVVLAVVAGSVPAAASLADGTPSSTEPGASFAGVVGVQGAEVNNEVENRSLDRQLRAAESNRSKARVVASESQQLEERLAELEAEKERLNAAYENGSISKGKYKAQLAVVAADLRALERRANHTADAAEKLPPEALRETGANVSEVREIARDANRTSGGEVAEAARDIAGKGVGDGLGGPPAQAGPPNGSETGAPESAGPPDGAGDNAGKDDNPGASPGGAAANVTNRSSNNPPSSAGTGAPNATNGTDRQPARAGNASSPANGSASGTAGGGQAADGNGSAADNRSTGNNGSDTANASNRSANASNESIPLPWPEAGADSPGSQDDRGNGNETRTGASVGRAVFSA